MQQFFDSIIRILTLEKENEALRVGVACAIKVRLIKWWDENLKPSESNLLKVCSLCHLNTLFRIISYH